MIKRDFFFLGVRRDFLPLLFLGGIDGVSFYRKIDWDVFLNMFLDFILVGSSFFDWSFKYFEFCF